METKMRYPLSYYYYNFISMFDYNLHVLLNKLNKLKLKKTPYFPSDYIYYQDFLTTINDICAFLNIDLNKFISYYEEHSIWPHKLWEECGRDADKFNMQIIGEYGRSNICANCISSFSLKYAYNVIYSLLDKINKHEKIIKVCDYGCANANISFSMLLRNKITNLTMYDYHSESTEFLEDRIKKYGLEKKATWREVDSLQDYNEYDMVICMDVLEHTKNPSEILETKIFPMLKKGGLLIAQAPWGGGNASHLDEAIFDFYGKRGRMFLRQKFKKIISMASLDISGVWVKK